VFEDQQMWMKGHRSLLVDSQRQFKPLLQYQYSFVHKSRWPVTRNNNLLRFSCICQKNQKTNQVNLQNNCYNSYVFVFNINFMCTSTRHSTKSNKLYLKHTHCGRVRHFNTRRILTRHHASCMYSLQQQRQLSC